MNSFKKDVILIVDDSKKNLDILVELLQMYDVICSLETENIFDIVTHEEVDLILLDIMMPNIDGFEVCKLLKENSKTNNIPIIFLTAKVDTHDIQKGFELGAVDYITKPFHPLELRMRVENHLNLYKYQKSLEAEVQKKLQEVQYTQQLLYQKNKQAEMGEFMMHIAHQWGQPLSELGSINNYQLAKLDIEDMIEKEEHKEYLRKNEKIIEFMSQTISTFQNFYKVNDNQEAFTMEEIIEEVWCLLGATLDYHGINLNFSLEKKELTSVKILGKGNEFAQILLSLLNNSKNIFIKKEIKNKMINIYLKEENSDLVVTVEDNAGGIKKENLSNIFEPFVSFSESTGMGLYLVKTICDKNNWKLYVKNITEGVQFKIICKEYK